MLVLPLPVALLDIFCFKHYFIFIDFDGRSSYSTPTRFLLVSKFVIDSYRSASGSERCFYQGILKDGHTSPDAAGQVIEAFGEFIVSGNYAVGLFVFAILVIINLVVITKGQGASQKLQHVL